MGGAGAHEDFLTVHGDILHGQHGFGPETADDKIDLVAGDQPLHGVGGVGHVQEFVGVGLDQFDLHLFLAHGHAALGIDLIGGHQSTVPVPLALDEIHRSDDPDLDGSGLRGERTRQQGQTHDQKQQPTHR